MRLRLDSPDGKARGPKSRTKAEQALGMLEDFLCDDRDADLLRVITPGFVEAYCRYLFGRSSEGADNETVYGWIDLFRRAVRSAIRMGFVPNVDVFPEIILKLEKDYPRRGTSARSRGAYSLQAPDFGVEFDRLLRILGDKGEFGVTERPLAVYATALLCMGLEIEDVLELKVKLSESGGYPTVWLGPRDTELPYAGTLAKLAELYNGRGYAGELLFGRPARGPEASSKLKEDIRRAMTFHRLNLYKSVSVFSDWLGIAVCRGASAASAARAAVWELGDERVGEDPVVRLASYVRDRGRLSPNWYVLCSYRASLRADGMNDKIMGLSAVRDIDGNCGALSTFNPHESIATKTNGKVTVTKRSVMGRYLFVRCLQSDCGTIEKAIPDASFLRKPHNAMERATVDESEIRRLMLFFNNYGDGMEIVNLAELARKSESDLSEGQRVRVQAGPCVGMEGMIIKTKKHDDMSGATKLFVVRLDSVPGLLITGNITAKLRGLDLKAL